MADPHLEEAQRHRLTSWITVVVIAIGAVVLGFAFVTRSIPLTIIGGVLLAGGVFIGGVTKIMDDVH